MNQLSWNAWIETLITQSNLSLDELCGELEGIVVTSVGRESTDDRYIGETQSTQFLKIDVNVRYVGEYNDEVFTRTVYNGMLPSCNYLSNFSQEQVFAFEEIVQKYFTALQSKNSHYWDIPVVETDLDLYQLMTLTELVLPLKRGMVCKIEDADSLQVFRKQPQPKCYIKASMSKQYFPDYGLAVYTHKDLISESTVLVPLTKLKDYSAHMLDEFVRVLSVCARKEHPIRTYGLQNVQ